MTSFRVNGKPAPQGSKTRGRYGGVYESSKAVGPWRDAIRTETQERFSGGRGFPRDVPLAVTVVFVAARPGSHYRTGASTRHLLKQGAPHFPAGRPDVDKLARAVLDGLVMGGAMADDSQVVSLLALKRYALDSETAGAEITLEAMPDIPLKIAVGMRPYGA